MVSIKNINGQYLHANTTLLKRFNLDSVEDILLKDDSCFIHAECSRSFIRDDIEASKGNEVLERLELNNRTNGERALFITTKKPIHNQDQEIIGCMAISAPIERCSPTDHRLLALVEPLQYLVKNYKTKIKVEDIANIACLSISALERRFKKYLLKTPTQIILELRLDDARIQIIETDAPISAVAESTGFTDHAHFTKQFSAQFGIAPVSYRSKYCPDKNKKTRAKPQ